MSGRRLPTTGGCGSRIVHSMLQTLRAAPSPGDGSLRSLGVGQIPAASNSASAASIAAWRLRLGARLESMPFRASVVF